MCVKKHGMSKEIVTKLLRNGLVVDVLVDAQDPDANENGQESLTNCLVDAVVSMQ